MTRASRGFVALRVGFALALLLVGCDDTAPSDTTDGTSTDDGTSTFANDDDSTSTNVSDDDDDDEVSCTPNCFNRNCGDDGCGRRCGSCNRSAGWSCLADYGVCVPDGMVYVPPGAFTRGCNLADDAECESDEVPSREVTLSAFAIDKTKVTVAAYRACIDAGVCTSAFEAGQTNNRCQWNKGDPDDYPIVCADYDEAASYCEWVGKRLPTEAEWEKAARGTDGRMYPWGNEEPDCSRADAPSPDTSERCVGSLSPVDSYPLGASPYGALDMMGFAVEWVADWYRPGYYEIAPTVDPQGPRIWGASQDIAVRGGMIGTGGWHVWTRIGYRPFGLPRIGFRCAISTDNDDDRKGDDDDASCTASCTGKNCGDDGCGGSCGVCAQGEFCNMSGYCQNVPSDMVVVPAGPFMRGCNPAVDAECTADRVRSCSLLSDLYCAADELPYREITLPSFLIDKTEVTIAAFQACAMSGCRPQSRDEQDCWQNFIIGEDHPVHCVTWLHAANYCAWADKRLPTEAEWEKAARGTDGRKYPWGNEPVTCALANFWNNTPNGCVGSTVPVGSYPKGASPYGALDMAGNVSEWVADWYDPAYYEIAPAFNPQGPASAGSTEAGEEERVARGGLYYSHARSASVSDRWSYDSPFSYSGVGFRCVISTQGIGAENSEASRE